MSENFIYSNTCPDIDKARDGIKEQLECEISELIEELIPVLAEPFREDLSKKFIVRIFDESLEDLFDKFRDINSDMRKEAEAQLNEKQLEINELVSDKEELELNIADLEEIISKLKE